MRFLMNESLLEIDPGYVSIQLREDFGIRKKILNI